MAASVFLRLLNRSQLVTMPGAGLEPARNFRSRGF